MSADHMHEHEHDHDRHHGQAHGLADFGMAFAIGVALNLGFVIVEGVYGIIGNSVALVGDAGHNLGDVLGLLTAWGASVMSRRLPSRRYTYGLRSTSILAALVNAVLLLIAIGGIAVAAVQRLVDPAPVAETTVIVVAAVGILVNAATAAMFMAGRRGDLNVRGAFLHMAADAAVSLGVVAAGFIILATGWLWLDPVVSLVIAAIIFIGTWRLLCDSTNLALAAVPDGIEPETVHDYLNGLPDVGRLHDLHIWAMSTTETALTCHLVMPGGHPGDSRIAAISQALNDRFGIAHVTIQVETGDPAVACVLIPDHVV